MKYLYGAAVQGIQSFIFQTNALQDIAGASELVEEICTDAFIGLFKKKDNEEWIKDHKVIAAAGNVKYILDEDECRTAVREFPKKVMEMAPGITISQAVVEYADDAEFSKYVNVLEDKLRVQRNRPQIPSTIGLLGMARSRQTGLPLIYGKKGKDCKPLDASTLAKKDASELPNLCKKSFFGYADDSCSELKPNPFVSSGTIAYDIKDMTKDNDWIAIIHADGNSLGQVVRKVGHDKEKYKEFSEKLDRATVAAANAAYNAVLPENGWGKNECIPIRPVVLGGDDMTVIIRGDLAIPYLTKYMEAFEEKTRDYLGAILKENNVFSDGTGCLTSCAGIAFIKSSYPFYYGYNLAEELCSAAKKVAKKGLNPDQKVKSCLMFHKVQDSFITSYDDIVKRELTPQKGISFKFGPYYLKTDEVPEGYMSIGQLTSLRDKLDSDGNEGVRSGIRQWLTLLHEDSGRAGQHLERVKEMHKSSKDSMNLIESLTTEYPRILKDGKTDEAFPAQDCLALYTIKYQRTKNR